MKIRIPTSRAYYPASRNEPEQLLCWIPARELAQLAAEGRIQTGLLEDYPSGLEVPVTRRGFGEFALDLGIEPEVLSRAYLDLHRAGALPESGYVAGAELERVAAPAHPTAAPSAGDVLPPRLGQKLSEPEWSDGEDARSVMQQL